MSMSGDSRRAFIEINRQEKRNRAGLNFIMSAAKSLDHNFISNRESASFERFNQEMFVAIVYPTR